MRSPLWIINSILVILFLAIIIFIGFSLRKILDGATITQIKPIGRPELPKEEKPKSKDIKLIYEGKDLFGTYRPITELAPVLKIPEMPKPPAPKPIITSQEPVVQFLEPLPIKISGIISHSNESKSQVTIVNTKTKESSSYKVGDKIFDAYIIRIFPKKIIIIRSNGQQETLYMYQEDAEKEIKELKEASWIDVVQQISPTSFVINANNFVKRITSLAQFIEMLDATTAFKKGSSIGCHIGKMDKKSIGYNLGFLPGDIITNIADIAPTSTTNRINIYNILSSVKHNDKIIIKLTRNDEEITQEYYIKTLPESNQSQTTENNNKSVKKIAKKNKKERNTRLSLRIPKNRISEHVKTLRRSNSIIPQVKELKKMDKQAMMQHGSKESVLKV